MTENDKPLAKFLLWSAVYWAVSLALWKVATALFTFGDCPGPSYPETHCWAFKHGVETVSLYALRLIAAAYAAGAIAAVWRRLRRRRAEPLSD